MIGQGYVSNLDKKGGEKHMALKIGKDSHLDHGLTFEQMAWVKERFKEQDGFFIETVELPKDLGTVQNALYGPKCGDEPVSDDDVKYAIRGNRSCASRLVDRPARPTNKLTVIAGPHGDDKCVLYTAFGGELSPKEPGDLTIESWGEIQESRQFWAEHALSSEE